MKTLLIALCLSAPALAAEPQSGILDGSLIERIEARADKIEQRAASLESSVREHGRLVERAASVLDRIGNLFRGLYYVLMAALGAAAVYFATGALKQIAGVLVALAGVVRAWRTRV